MKSPVPNDKQPTSRANERLSALTFAVEPYTLFNHQMDEQLARLVAQWQHLAAPNAERIGPSSRHSGNS